MMMRRNASALIVVLWVIGLLSILISSFIFDAHIEAGITSYYRKRMKAEHIAKSGIEIAKMLMDRSAKVSATKSEDDFEDGNRWDEFARKLKIGGVEGLEEEIGGGVVVVDIIPETARRDVNRLGKNVEEIEKNLELILTVGGITEEMGIWPELIDSFKDWTDKDDDPSEDGAETEDYYETLEKPYEARNGPLETVGELLLIKGFDGKSIKGFNGNLLNGGVILNGGEDGENERISGIEDLLTIYGGDKVNPNIASERVLMTLPNVDDVVAGAIMEERTGVNYDDAEGDEDHSFKDMGDFRERTGIEDKELERYLAIGSGVFRVTSVGNYGGVKRKLWCIMRYTANKTTIVRWKEED